MTAVFRKRGNLHTHMDTQRTACEREGRNGWYICKLRNTKDYQPTTTARREVWTLSNLDPERVASRAMWQFLLKSAGLRYVVMTDLQNYFHGGTVEVLCRDLGVIVLNVSVLFGFYKIISFFWSSLRFTAKQRKVQRFSMYSLLLHSHSFFHY